MGNTAEINSYQARIIAEKSVQIRHNALKSVGIVSKRVLIEKLENNYRLKNLRYQHVTLRENKLIFGAHADRLQDGMRTAFGKAIGLVTRVKSGQSRIIANINEAGIEVAAIGTKTGKPQTTYTLLCGIRGT